MKGKFKEVKAGGRFAQKSAGAAPKGRPSAKMGGASRGEFATECVGKPGGKPGSQFSNRGAGEYSQASA